MGDKCKSEYTAMLKRIDQVINDKWPETLRDDGGVWRWIDQHRVELRLKLRELKKQIGVAWSNGIYDEMRQLVLVWGKLTLEMFREYSLYLRKMEGA